MIGAVTGGFFENHKVVVITRMVVKGLLSFAREVAEAGARSSVSAVFGA